MQRGLDCSEVVARWQGGKASGELHVQMLTHGLLLLIIKRKYYSVDLSSLRTFKFCSSFYVICSLSMLTAANHTLAR